MLKTCKRVLCASLLLAASSAQAELPEGYKMVVLTENFPPFNMAVDDKNFARDDGIDGISAEIVREMFKRAGIDYSMTRAFPGIACTG